MLPGDHRRRLGQRQRQPPQLPRQLPRPGLVLPPGALGQERQRLSLGEHIHRHHRAQPRRLPGAGDHHLRVPRRGQERPQPVRVGDVIEHQQAPLAVRLQPVAHHPGGRLQARLRVADAQPGGHHRQPGQHLAVSPALTHATSRQPASIHHRAYAAATCVLPTPRIPVTARTTDTPGPPARSSASSPSRGWNAQAAAAPHRPPPAPPQDRGADRLLRDIGAE